ncbi:MAG TPA: phosphohistidine phosphatase SixA [Terriglobales bacterium]|nr:phosphohistidine phosphatase SixA [Terriglobales bacterium]
MILYFLRHASAGTHRSSQKSDDKRPLDRDGIEQCRELGRALAALELDVDLIISSPLKRATQTAALVANEIGYEGKVQQDAALRPESNCDAFRDLLGKYAKAESIMLVGHNPTLSEFLSLLISDGGNDRSVDLKKCAIARVERSGSRPATLHWCLTPKLLRAAYEAAATSSRPKTWRK